MMPQMPILLGRKIFPQLSYSSFKCTPTTCIVIASALTKCSFVSSNICMSYPSPPHFFTGSFPPFIPFSSARSTSSISSPALPKAARYAPSSSTVATSISSNPISAASTSPLNTSGHSSSNFTSGISDFSSSSSVSSKKDEPVKKSGLHKVCRLNSPLSLLLGKEQASRIEVNRAVWDYIKKHNLQDPRNRRNIVPDTKLKEVLGKDEINMFEMQKVLSKYIVSLP